MLPIIPRGQLEGKPFSCSIKEKSSPFFGSKSLSLVPAIPSTLRFYLLLSSNMHMRSKVNYAPINACSCADYHRGHLDIFRGANVWPRRVVSATGLRDLCHRAGGSVPAVLSEASPALVQRMIGKLCAACLICCSAKGVFSGLNAMSVLVSPRNLCAVCDCSSSRLLSSHTPALCLLLQATWPPVAGQHFCCCRLSIHFWSSDVSGGQRGLGPPQHHERCEVF